MLVKTTQDDMTNTSTNSIKHKSFPKTTMLSSVQAISGQATGTVHRTDEPGRGAAGGRWATRCSDWAGLVTHTRLSCLVLYFNAYPPNLAKSLNTSSTCPVYWHYTI